MRGGGKNHTKRRGHKLGKHVHCSGPARSNKGHQACTHRACEDKTLHGKKWHCKMCRRLRIVLTSCLQSVQVTIVADQWRRHTQYRFTCCKPTNPRRHHKHTDGPITTTNTGCSFRRTDIVDKALGRATAHLPNSSCVLGHVHTKRISAVQQLLQTVHMSLSLHNTIHQGP